MIRYLLIVSLLLLACEEKPAETIEIGDLIEGVGEEDSTKTEVLKVNYADSLHPSLRLLVDSLDLPLDGLAPLDTSFYLDQFQAISHESWSLPVGNFHYFQYKDSLQSKNAFFNWMDCFGSNCQTLNLWEETKISKRNEWVVVFEKELLYYQGELSLDADLLDYLEKQKAKERILYILQIPANKKTRWWVKQEDKWIIKKENEVSK